LSFGFFGAKCFGKSIKRALPPLPIPVLLTEVVARDYTHARKLPPRSSRVCEKSKRRQTDAGFLCVVLRERREEKKNREGISKEGGKMGSTMHATQSELQAAKVDLAYRGRGVSTLRQFASVQAPLQDTQNGPYNQPDTPGSANPSLTRIWSRNHSSSDTPAVTPARACDPARGLLRAPADPAQHVPQERVLPAVEVRARAPRVREVPVQRVSAPLIFSPRPRKRPSAPPPQTT
jgi:hypothetical protein